MNDWLLKLGVCAFLYAIGASIIQYVCVAFIVHIPLLDHFALAIRNILCIVLFILCVIMFFIMVFSK